MTEEFRAAIAVELHDSPAGTLIARDGEDFTGWSDWPVDGVKISLDGEQLSYLAAHFDIATSPRREEDGRGRVFTNLLDNSDFPIVTINRRFCAIWTDIRAKVTGPNCLELRLYYKDTPGHGEPGAAPLHATYCGPFSIFWA